MDVFIIVINIIILCFSNDFPCLIRAFSQRPFHFAKNTIKGGKTEQNNKK